MIQLPCPINQQAVRATYKNGVLTIRAPRLTDRRRKTHRILIEGE
jgi:HSP20 family molecular chaperone IbpA